jgi:gliding motility-associated-like protein
MKYLFSILWVAVLSLANHAFAQCGGSEVCNGNTGLYSNDDATNIAYDNMGSAYHSTFIKEPNSGWKVWGANMSNNNGQVLSPLSVNTTNFPALTGTIYKLAIGSESVDSQLVVLTSTGLFTIGDSGIVFSTSITNGFGFHKITVNGKADGLPPNVTPNDVKMLFASTSTLMITTCAGGVYVLSQLIPVRGNGGTGTAIQWAQVMENSTTPLSNVIVSRGNSEFGFALKADGTLWTWGAGTYLGNGTVAQTRNYAMQMTLPAGMPAVKMIQATSYSGDEISYYVLGTDKKVYSLGENFYGQLGDRTTVDRTGWVNAKNPDNSVTSDAAWISANEHDYLYPGVSVIRAGGLFYTAGRNSYFMIGRAVEDGTNYLALPAGIAATDVITHAEVGGHSTAVIRLGSIRYGYVGHRVNGSMGDGSSLDMSQTSFDFITPPIVAVCGTLCIQPVLTSNSPICPGSTAVFTISGTPGDIVTYSLNSAAVQTATIGPGGTVAVTVPNALADQNVHLTYILGGTGSCSNFLSSQATVTVSGNVTPAFTQVQPICAGDPLVALPLTSTNGVTGTWDPAIDNAQTTLYTFTPVTGSCASTATMNIVVNPMGTSASFTQVAPICRNETLAPLPTTSTNGIQGTWSPAMNNQATTTYVFTPALTGCIPSTSMTIQVNPLVVPLFTQPAPICEGDVLNPLPAISSNNVSGSWAPATNNTLTTIYTFTPVVGSCADVVQMTIVVNTKTLPAFTQVAPVCEGSIMPALPVLSNNGISGTWSPALNNTATTTYTFTPSTGVCAHTAPMTIIVNQKTMPTFTAPDIVCFGDPDFSLPTLSANGINGSWTPEFSNTTSTTYTFTPDTDECAHITQLPIEVFEDWAFDITKYCEEGNLMLEVLPTLGALDMSTADFIWQINNSIVGTDAVFNVQDYLDSTPATDGLPLTFTATVTDSNGCPKVKEIVIDNIFCTIQKGISPNNDGANEFFDLRLLDVTHLSIFNRYGVKVYSKGNYYDEWRGQADNGNLLPDAAYYYVVDLDGEPSRTGWIYLSREN